MLIDPDNKILMCSRLFKTLIIKRFNRKYISYVNQVELA